MEFDGDGYKLTIRDADADKTYTQFRHKDRSVLLQKAWQAISVLVLLVLSACGDNLCGCPFGMVCQPASRQEGFVCVPPQISNK